MSAFSCSCRLKTGGREEDGWQGVEAQPRQVHRDLLLRLLECLEKGEYFKMAVSRLIRIVEQKEPHFRAVYTHLQEK